MLWGRSVDDRMRRNPTTDPPFGRNLGGLLPVLLPAAAKKARPAVLLNLCEEGESFRGGNLGPLRIGVKYASLIRDRSRIKNSCFHALILRGPKCTGQEFLALPYELLHADSFGRATNSDGFVGQPTMSFCLRIVGTTSFIYFLKLWRRLLGRTWEPI